MSWFTKEKNRIRKFFRKHKGKVYDFGDGVKFDTDRFNALLGKDKENEESKN